MKKLLLILSMFLLVSVPAMAVEDATSDGELSDPVVENDISSEDVPMPGGFSDWWLQNITERFETFIARTDEKRVDLEEKFADRREAQLEKLENLPDDHPQKEALIERLEERHAKHIENIEDRAERLTDKKAEILERLTEKKDRFEAKKEWLLERKEDRGEMKEEIKNIMDEIKEKRGEIIDENREEIKAEITDKRAEIKDLRTDFKERVKAEAVDRAEKLEDRVKAVEAREVKRNHEEEQESYEDGDVEDHEPNEDSILGTMDYQPLGFFEELGWWLQGR